MKLNFSIFLYSLPSYDLLVDKLLDKMDFLIPGWLYSLDFFEKRGMEPRQLRRGKATDIPLQAPMSGDCGAWTCIYMKRLITGELMKHHEEDVKKTADMFRQDLAILCFSQVIRSWIPSPQP
jgi:hypothetical protein